MTKPNVSPELQKVVTKLIAEHHVVCKFGTDEAYEKSKTAMGMVIDALIDHYGSDAVECAVICAPDPDMEGL